MNVDSRSRAAFPGMRQRSSRRRIAAAGILAAALLCAGCATTGRPSNPADPLESFNRGAYEFNDTIDRYALKPVAQGYRKVVPEPLQLMVRSFIGNLADVLTAVNNLLQANSASNNALYDIELTGDSYRFGFLTPRSHDNTVKAAPFGNLKIKNCGDNNVVMGGQLVDNTADPCN